jgi:hypothetical protein
LPVGVVVTLVPNVAFASACARPPPGVVFVIVAVPVLPPPFVTVTLPRTPGTLNVMR